MIKSISFENFFSLKNTRVNLCNKENILIGINGSGKTNFLKAIKLLKEGVAGSGLSKLILDSWGGFDNIYFRDLEDKVGQQQITIEYLLDAEAVHKSGSFIKDEKKMGFTFRDDIYYKIIINKIPGLSNYYLTEELYQRPQNQNEFIYLKFHNGKGQLFGKPEENGNNPQLVKYSDIDPQELALNQVKDPDRFLIQHVIRKAISECVVYEYFDTTPNSRIRKPMLPTSEKRLFADGSNLPQILNTLRINHKKHFKLIQKRLNEVNENFRDIDFNFIGGNIELMLEESGLNKSIHVSNISDGTLHYLCLLAIFFNPERGRLVCIDEPELGMHPDMILNIANAIQEASGESQFIIATHSENLLNAFDLGSILVFEKDRQNATIVHQYTEEDFKGWYEEFSTGKMWRQGDLGGNRW